MLLIVFLHLAFLFLRKRARQSGLEPTGEEKPIYNSVSFIGDSLLGEIIFLYWWDGFVYCWGGFVYCWGESKREAAERRNCCSSTAWAPAWPARQPGLSVWRTYKWCYYVQGTWVSGVFRHVLLSFYLCFIFVVNAVQCAVKLSIVVVNAHLVLSQAVVRRMSRPDHSAPRFLLLRWF